MVLASTSGQLADVMQSRRVRVFVSSAFQDMHPERNELVKHAFPHLRKICETRGLIWSEVDLRWGVTEEAVAEHRAAQICLEEVERCRPFLIGILGSHYGPLTEKEIERGALGEPVNALARFYFRAGTGVEALEKLKTRIRNSGLFVRDGYRSPEELSAWVRTDFDQLIQELFPAGGTPDSEDLEQASFALSRTTLYVERPALCEVLDAHFLESKLPLVFTGEAGSGKSSLLAWWAARLREEHPEALIIFHSIGASTYSTDWRALMGRLIKELSGEVPRDLAISSWRDALQRALDRAAAQRTVVIVIDALNQLDDIDGAPDLPWLPESFAPGVRMVLSTLPGPPLDESRRRGFPEAEVTPLTATEKAQVIREYLDFYGKELSEARTALLIDAEATSNPLFLRALLDELRQFGSYLRLDERLALYLRARVPEDLFAMILERYETDYEGQRPGLVRDVCSYLLAARRGLSETELLGVLGGPEEPLPQLYWSPLFLAAESSLVTRSGLLNFGHDYIRRAANRRYPCGEETHGRLAAYFRTRDPGRRKAEELPWQLLQAHDWGGLRDLLLDPPFLAVIRESSPSDLKHYWSALEAKAGMNRADAYRPFVESPERLGHYWLFVTNLLEETGYPKQAAGIYEYLANREQPPAAYAQILGNLAMLQKRFGDLDRAYELHRREEVIFRELNDDTGLERSIADQAHILTLKGKLREALELRREEESLARKRGDQVSVAACLGSQAPIETKLGNMSHALDLHREAERLYRAAGDRQGVQNALFDLAILSWQEGELNRGLKMFVERERQARALGERRWISKAVGMQGVVLQSVGRFKEALERFEEQTRICRQIHEWIDLQSALNNVGRVLLKLGRNQEALTVLREQETMCREQGYLEALQTCLQNQGGVCLAEGDTNRAWDLFREQEQICERLGNLSGLGEALGGQALVLHRLGQFTNAMELRKREEHIARQLDDPEMLSTSLTNQAVLHCELGDAAAAFELFDASDDIDRRIGARDALRISLGKRAELHERLGQNQKALASYQEQQVLAQELANRHAEERALRNQARVLLALGDARSALNVFGQVEALATDSIDQAREAANQAAILEDLDRRAEAANAAQRAISLLAAHESSDEVAAIRNLAQEVLDGHDGSSDHSEDDRKSPHT
jgi:tetratricopeptide (TPR) repeat protein